MIPTNRFIDYPELSRQEMFSQIEEFHKIFEEANVVLQAKKAILEGKAKRPPKVEVVATEGVPSTEENCVWINPSIKTTFHKMKDAKLPLHECLTVYDNWFDELFKLTIVNEHVLHKKVMFTHVAEILVICSTFHLILQKAMEGSEQPDPRMPA